MRRAARLVAAGLLAAPGCGGEPPLLVMEKLELPPPALESPKASPEEVSGEVPPLRPLRPARPLVPEGLVPPAPPPEPVFEEE